MGLIMCIRGWRGISTAGAAALGGGAPGGGSSGRRHCGRLAGDYGVREMEGGGSKKVREGGMDALPSNQQAPSPPPPQVNRKVIQGESCRLNGELIGVPTGLTAV